MCERSSQASVFLSSMKYIWSDKFRSQEQNHKSIIHKAG
jgi:hypothetical protein